jgi:cobalamin synthase
MAAGLPGTGIGGLFFILSALFMIVVETQRTIRGKSSLARWRIVGRHAAVAATMVVTVTVAIWLVHRLLFAANGKAGGANGDPPGAVHQLLPYLPVLITLGVLMLVLLGGYLAKWVFGRQAKRVRPYVAGRPQTRPTTQPPAEPTTEPLLATPSPSKQ